MMGALESDPPPVLVHQDKDSSPVKSPGRAVTVAQLNRPCGRMD